MTHSQCVLGLLGGLLSGGLLVGAGTANAVETRVWSQGAAADYEKATLRGVSLRSDGRISLAPAMREMLDAGTGALWAIVRDRRGTIYAAGTGSGSSCRIFRVDVNGQSSPWAEIEGLEIHALALDAQDHLFAATSPDGQVWKVGPDGKAVPFYDPKAKYIWALSFDSQGQLLVATGDRGELHRVSPGGQGRVWFRLEDAHVRSLVLDRSGNVLVGSEPSGLIVRVSPAGEGFVLHQSSKREVTALAVRPDGTLFATAVGTKTVTPPPVLPLPLPAPPPAAPAASNAPRAPASGAPPVGPLAGGVTGGSELISIAPDGEPSVIWTHAQEIAYSLALDPQGLPWVGTGNKGAIYRIDSPVLATHLRAVAPGQVTGLLGASGTLFAITASVGKLLALGPEREPAGTVESEIFDAGRFARWGRLDGGASGSGQVVFETRSGNLDRAQSSWSPWAELAAGRVSSPPARFLQWRARLNAPAAGSSGPELLGVDVAWLSKNVAPRVEQVEATPLNYRFPSTSSVLTSSPPTLTMPPLGRRAGRSSGVPLDTSPSSSVTLTYAKGAAGLRWLAQDDNGDTLAYRVEIRGANESGWKLLRDKISDRFAGFDSTAFPDGEYVARVTATDAPDNPPGQALTGFLESSPFLIDNTAPVIEDLSGQPAGGRIQLRFRARDELSWIAKAEYSLNGVEWLRIEPASQLSDSRELSYDVLLDRPAPGEVTVAVRVTDSEDNQCLAKVVVR